MSTIIPIKDLTNTAKVSELCHSQQEPVFITKDGYSSLVIMSAATYEKQIALLEVYRKLGEAEDLERNGTANMDGREVFDRLRVKYGQKAI
ncbi:MAG: type II toxin-antitoxin system Phd/YefM family antitoxin [Defluviitaleaceae bacterium]|jgi:PHD/YefM family antitoxin component YafN of YafNO toxin-antitoxin module|nr:type II toxin-antitoxin system Phd/YefM family antitoxin [Defluviitaleaceae bacterium]